MKRRVKLIKKARSISVRKCPWDPFRDEEVARTFKAGDPITIDDEEIVYDRQNRTFYAAYDEGGLIGYLRQDAIDN